MFNSDQGCQFTSQEFISVLSGAGISMDGKGRCLDNILVERLWRSVKYENVYLYGYQNITEAKAALDKYFIFYNYQRFHQSLDNKMPWQVYSQNGKVVDYGLSLLRSLKMNPHAIFLEVEDSKLDNSVFAH